MNEPHSALRTFFIASLMVGCGGGNGSDDDASVSPREDAGSRDASASPDAGEADGGAGEGDGGSPIPTIGPRPVAPTPLDRGTLLAAPDGTGDGCTEAAPCSIWEVVDQASAADVVFLRGGVYAISRNLSFRGRGDASSPPTFESYPGEVAILDGSTLGPSDEVYVRIYDGPVVLRLFEIRNMPKAGISVRNSDNVLEGLTVYDNLLSGIHVHESYEVPSSNDNLITDCVVYGNSGVGLDTPEYADGGNSDGISMSSGIGNRVEHCLVYGNSDDGVDTWRTTDSYVGYTIVHGNGLGSGNGQGVKAGGAEPSSGTVVERCLSHSNRGAGIDQNSGLAVSFRNNTTWDNGRGYWLGDDTVVSHNIAYEAEAANAAGDQTDNSWQRDGTPTPLSTDPGSPDFLRPTESAFEDIGAHAGL